ncbi:MAG: alanine racemase [Leptonema sp. (in: Bacteria)]|nr:alanine racemase [Leptonema sp. (in: bacteria)]
MLHRVEISKSALINSVSQYRSIIGNSQFFGVVKSNAYGHGIRESVLILSPVVDGFAVNHISEASQVYELTDRPFLIMGRYDFDESSLLLDLDSSRITVVLSDLDEIKHLVELRPDMPFHLKIDTGMGRLGYRKDSQQLHKIFEYLEKNQTLRWSGMMTHFANVEDVTDQSFAQYQLQQFAEIIHKALRAAGSRRLIQHSAASAAALILPKSRLDLVRVGISLYGLWPSKATQLSYISMTGDKKVPTIDFKPALRWLTKIVHINQLDAESKIGYGCTFQTHHNTRVAVLPVGYYEGYDRGLSNCGYVVIDGKQAPVIGRVCMNMTMVDVTHIPNAKVGSEVVLIGEGVSADSLADLLGTIHYEVVTRIHPNLPRLIVD